MKIDTIQNSIGKEMNLFKVTKLKIDTNQRTMIRFIQANHKAR